ncbi:MAG: DUF3482 domain-containing protein [Rhodospirillales bacterium]
MRAGSGAAARRRRPRHRCAATAGLTLGAAAALGAAAVGALWSGFSSHGRRVADVFRGYRSCGQDETLRLLAARQAELIAAQPAAATPARTGCVCRARPRCAAASGSALLPSSVEEARQHPEWSRFVAGGDAGSAAGRTATCEHLADTLVATLAPEAGAGAG